jgi:hypothetical protein
MLPARRISYQSDKMLKYRFASLTFRAEDPFNDAPAIALGAF